MTEQGYPRSGSASSGLCRFLGALLLAGSLSCRSEPPVAKVGRLAIGKTEFERKLAEVSVGYQNYVNTPNGRKQFLDVLVREKLMLAAALDSDAQRSPIFRSEMERLQAEQEQTLREQKDFLVTRLWLEGLRQNGVINTGVGEARDYHRKHPLEVGVSHILTATSEEAQELEKNIRSGMSFAAAAKAHSLDFETAADGGRMAPAMYGEIIPDLEDVAFRMRVGDIGGPFKSKFGYHVIRKDFERKLAFEDCQDRVIRLLEKAKLDRHLQSLQAKFPVEVVDEQFR
ncbi:MAG: peptidylprolyl isomerase [Elusimicrobia bacterium]|nr:peptidylprolyl isomerase [Elusimicrobiota bacterium]